MTLRVELVPTLDHCIETTAKREYARAIQDYTQKGGDDTTLEEYIGVLQKFLEESDFRQLRRDSESYLLEGKQVVFTIYLRDGTTVYDMHIK